MRVFASVRTPPPKRQPRTGVPGVVVNYPRQGDEFVPVDGFDRIVAVARRGALVGWAWVSRVFGVETVQEARHAGASFGHWEEYAPLGRLQ